MIKKTLRLLLTVIDILTHFIPNYLIRKYDNIKCIKQSSRKAEMVGLD